MDWLLSGFVPQTRCSALIHSTLVALLGSTLAGLASAFPAVAMLVGFVFILLGSTDEIAGFVQGGWGLITVAVIIEFVLPISRRLR